MLFNSLAFLFGFLPVTYLIFWWLKTRGSRYVWLTITGYVFYSFWNYKFCALMAFSTLVSYLAGLGLLHWSDARHRRLCLVIPIVTDLLLLGFFKYANFTIATYDSLAQWLHIPQQVKLSADCSAHRHLVLYVPHDHLHRGFLSRDGQADAKLL